MKKFTEKQLEIINSNSKNILVSASAGTGKTTVMVERIAKIIKEDSKITPEDILVITFSNASAKEMKNRIIDRLEEDHINIDLNSKNISTIHAFCKRVIEDNSEYIKDLSYDFELVDSVFDKLLKNELVFNFLEPKREDKELILIEKSLSKLTSTEDLLLDLYERYNPYTLSFDENKIRNLEKTVESSLNDYVIKTLYDCFNKYQNLIDLTSNIPHPKIDNLLGKMDEEELQIKNIIDGKSFEFNGVVRFPAKSPEFDHLKDIRKKIVDKVKMMTSLNLDSEMEDIKKMKPVINYLFDLILEFSSFLENEYIKRNKLNFNMLEDIAIKILKSNKQLNKKYVFVDEYQDVSNKQAYLINLLLNENSNIFKIGDLKQSIYAFRGGDSEIFKKSMKDADVFSLNENFRTNTNIINYVNNVFNKIEKFNYGNEKLVGTLEGGIVDIYDLSLNNNEKLLKSEKDEIELENIIKVIKSEIKNGKKYGDIAILSRKLGSSSNKISKVFKEKNIPFKIEKTINVLDTYEARVFISLMKTAFFNENDINIDLVSVAHFGLFSLNDQDIINCKNDLLKLINNNIKNFRMTLDKYKNHPMSVQIRKIIKLSNFYDFLYFKDGAIDNIETVIDYILSNNFKSIYQVVYHLNKLIKLKIEINLPIKKNRENEVLITTIHRSKGLEFNTVIIPFAGDSFSKVETSKEFIFDKNLGLGFNFIDEDNNFKELFFKNIIKDNIKSEQELEELRLLYVALTRAKNKLIIQGFKENKSLMQYI